MTRRTGAIVVLGAPEEVKRTEMRGEVVEIDCAAPAQAIAALRQAGLAQEVALYGAQIHAVTADPAAFRAQAGRLLAAEGIAVHSLETIAPSLEDVFIASVRGGKEQVE